MSADLVEYEWFVPIIHSAGRFINCSLPRSGLIAKLNQRVIEVQRTDSMTAEYYTGSPPQDADGTSSNLLDLHKLF